ncbi:MAG: flavoprotein [Isosphaeraceae bacterium]|nr:flavoprotein [Isosphaeraceae bacterium]
MSGSLGFRDPPRVVLGVTGSVAAVRLPLLYRGLIDAGMRVRIVATRHAGYFFDPADLPAPEYDPDRAFVDHQPGGPLFGDDDEWPGDRRRDRDEEVRHIAFRDWADLLLVAPLDAHTLAKFAYGFADNFLSCIYRAWDFRRPVVLAPAMNTRMWDSPVTRRQFATLLADHAISEPPGRWTLDEVAAVFATHAPGLVVIPPIEKRLACGDVGIGAMAEVDAIVATVVATVERQSPKSS